MALSDDGHIVAETARRLFADLPMSIYADVAAGAWPAKLWADIDEAGLPLALCREEDGGYGLPLADGLEIIRLSGAFALPVPLAETMIANWLLATAGLPLGDGAMTFSPGALHFRDGHVVGELHDVPWLRFCNVVAHVRSNDGTFFLASLPRPTGVTHGSSIAGEPRDAVSVNLAPDTFAARLCPQALDLQAAGAAMRALQLSGAATTVTEMTLGHVQDRSQFGRALGAFQVVQHTIAQMAGETAASATAGDLAISAFEDGLNAARVAVAKIRTGEASGKLASLSHQLHGAMGFTQEHRLHLFTRRLWAWRDDFGGEAAWSAALGRLLMRPGSSFWSGLTKI